MYSGKLRPQMWHVNQIDISTLKFLMDLEGLRWQCAKWIMLKESLVFLVVCIGPHVTKFVELLALRDDTT